MCTLNLLNLNIPLHNSLCPACGKQPGDRIDIMQQSLADPDSPHLVDEELKELTAPAEQM